uniref:Uncharacterized protein n=1 Tax=Schistocephalus solidus TaxID=70667 RepID=A0A0X3NZW4_SCHSO
MRGGEGCQTEMHSNFLGCTYFYAASLKDRGLPDLYVSGVKLLFPDCSFSSCFASHRICIDISDARFLAEGGSRKEAERFRDSSTERRIHSVIFFFGSACFYAVLTLVQFPSIHHRHL